jgi:DNA polymerase-3 subunit gamma/tau
MAYLSLYRKYRPQTFADVVGQDHVVQTLQNALKSGHIANGYLFCGTRGVAKTTMARILAKGLNCIGADDSATVAQSEPCNVCAPCRAIAAGQAVDVVEMDAASNRSVNDIAKLRESVQFGPMENRYKVYIVDEAHQLSSDAKDAFLKTLEEPPANVVFILATTETHAIPITIASRCQRFDFKRGSIGQISKQVSRVLGYEHVTMHADAIVMIARAADGSYRDALSLLDQVLAYKREDITGNDVAEVLGTVKTDLLTATIQKIAESDFAGVFTISEQIFNQGKDVRQFLKTLAIRFRDMLFLSSGAKSSDDDQSLEDPILAQQAKQFTPSAMLEALTVITEAERETRNSNQHRLLLEMALLKLTKLPAVPIEIVVGAQARQAPEANGSAPLPSLLQQPRPELVLDSVQTPEIVADAMVDDGDDEEVDVLTIPMFGLDNEPSELPPVTAPAPPRTVAPMPTELPTRAPAPVSRDPVGKSNNQEDLIFLKSHWSEAINHMRVVAPGGVSLMTDATPIDQTGQTITLEFTQSSFIARLESPRAMEKLQDVINKVLKKAPKTFKVRAVLRDDSPRPVAAEPTHINPIHQHQPVPDDSPTDLLDEVISIFGGRIIDEGTGNR